MISDQNVLKGNFHGNRNARVLIIVDNQLVASEVTCALEATGIDCIHANDGVTGLEIFEKLRPEGVIMEVTPVGIHGMELLRSIKKVDPYVPLITLAGKGEDSLAVESLKLGADDTFPKFAKTTQLADTLKSAISHLRNHNKLSRKGAETLTVTGGIPEEIILEAPFALIYVNPAGQITFANRKAAILLGTEMMDLGGTDLGDIVGPEVKKGWVSAVRKAAPTPGGYEGEVRVRRGRDNWFPAKVIAVDGHEIGYLILTIQDLTREKMIEAKLVESKRLASLGHVVDGVAHEVRNPLISIGGFARNLRKRFEEGSHEAEIVDIILGDVNRLEHMVVDIEEYVNFTRSRPHNFIALDVIEILRRSADHVERLQATKGQVSFSRALPDETVMVFGARELLTELFTSLIENARDSIVGEGEVSVSVDLLAGWVKILVKDTGEGIPDEDLDFIFDPFFTSKTSGAGLGLAKAYLIVEDHMGQIKFTSKVGEGTVCSVLLPLERRKFERM